MSRYLVGQLAEIREQVAQLLGSRVGYVEAPVTGVDPGTSTFTVQVADQQDAATLELGGIVSPPHFLPTLGDTVLLALSGAKPIYQPGRVAAGAIGYNELDPGVVDDIAAGGGDTTTPDAPTGLSLSTSLVQAADGSSTATLTASWVAPTTNTDGSAITDLSHFLVEYRWTARAPHWDTRVATESIVDITGLGTGLGFDVQVAAVDTSGHISGFTPVESITTAADTTPPVAPSTPTVSNYLGQLRIAWDGLDDTGAAMAADTDRVEVHVSGTSGFTPSDATMIDQLNGAGESYATTAYGVTQYAKLVAVDRSGNRSAASAQGSGATAQVVSADIFDGAVGTAKLADLAVTTAKIDDLAVNDAKIGNVSAGKITAGTIDVDVEIAGRVTTAPTGARVQFDSTGIQGYEADGVTKWLSLTESEKLMTGTYKTAVDTSRRVEIGSSSTEGLVSFIAADGTTSIVGSALLSGGAEGLIHSLPISGTHQFWNTFRLDTTELAFLDAKNVHLGFGGAAGNGGGFRVYWASSKGDATTAPPLTTRFQIDEGGLTYWDNTPVERLTISATDIVYWDGAGTARMDLSASSTRFWDPANHVRLYIDNSSTVLYDATDISRLSLDGASTTARYWSDGTFFVVERGRAAPNVEATKMAIQFDSINFYRGPSQDFHVYDRVDSTTLANRFSVTDTDVWFQWPSVNYRVVLAPSDNSGNSSLLQLIHQSNFGITLCFRGNVDGSAGRLQVTDAANTTFMPVYASAFTVSSSGETKTEIVPLGFDAMDRIRSAPVKAWRRVGPRNADDRQGPTGPVEYGWIAEEAPAEAVVHNEDGSVFGLSVTSEIGLLIAALQQLDGRLAALEAAVTPRTTPPMKEQ